MPDWFEAIIRRLWFYLGGGRATRKGRTWKNARRLAKYSFGVGAVSVVGPICLVFAPAPIGVALAAMCLAILVGSGLAAVRLIGALSAETLSSDRLFKIDRVHQLAKFSAVVGVGSGVLLSIITSIVAAIVATNWPTRPAPPNATQHAKMLLLMIPMVMSISLPLSFVVWYSTRRALPSLRRPWVNYSSAQAD